MAPLEKGGIVKPDIKCGLCLLEWVYGRAVSQNRNKDIPQLFKNITKLLAHNMDSSTNLGAICNDRSTSFMSMSRLAHPSGCLNRDEQYVNLYSPKAKNL